MTAPVSSTPISKFVTIVVWGVGLVLTLLPLMRAEFPPGADMLNHVARVHILHNLPNDGDLQRYYQADWSIIPNLAFDIFSIPLLNFLPAHQVGKLFLALAVLMMFAGVSALRYQLHGKVGLLPLCVGLIAYSSPLALGFANYTFGLGLVLLMVAGWRAAEKLSPGLRFIIGSGFSVLLFFTHLIAFGLYGFVLLTTRLGERWRGKHLNLETDLPLAGQFIIPAVLWFQVKPAALGTDTVFGSLYTRLEALVSPVLYFNDFDVAAALCLLVLLIWLLFTRRLRISPVFLLVIIALSVISLVMPVRLFGVWLTHIRIPLLVALLLIASLEVHISERLLRNFVAVALISIALIRLDKIDSSISGCDAKRQQFVEALAPLEPGSRLLPVVEKDSVTGDCLFSNYWHLPALAVLEKSAFYPMMFVHLQPLAIRAEFSHLVQKIAEPASPPLLHNNTNTYGEPDWNATIATNWRSDFDYLVWLHPGTSPKKIPDHVRKIGGTDFFTIFKIGTK